MPYCTVANLWPSSSLVSSSLRNVQLLKVCDLSFPPPYLLLLTVADPTVEKVSIDKIRFFRVERSYAVKSGKWYFEFEVVTGGDMRVGWARPGCRPDIELGADDQAFVFEGSRVSLLSSHSPSLQIYFPEFFLEAGITGSLGLRLQRE